MFTPILTDRRICAFLVFPVNNIEFVLDALNERLRLDAWDSAENGGFYTDLENCVKKELSGIADIYETCVYGDISYTLSLEEGKTEQDALKALEKACETFWNRYRLDRTKEVKKAMQAQSA